MSVARFALAGSSDPHGFHDELLWSAPATGGVTTMGMVDAEFSPAEERANAISAGSGMLLSIAALVLMASSVSGRGALHMISACVFGVSLVILYCASMLNHALPPGRTKDGFHIVDLAAIYVLIAGSYTPFCLIALHTGKGYFLFIAIWLMAVVGCVRKIIWPNDYDTGVDKISVISYVVMGWLVIVAPFEMVAAVPLPGLVWMGVGGLFYTGGIVFFRMTKLRHHHLIWHLFVIGGSACHVIAVCGYVLPLP